jgi:hypothetical protein
MKRYNHWDIMKTHNGCLPMQWGYLNIPNSVDDIVTHSIMFKIENIMLGITGSINISYQLKRRKGL